MTTNTRTTCTIHVCTIMMLYVCSLSNFGSRLNDVSGSLLVIEVQRLPGGPLVTSFNVFR